MPGSGPEWVNVSFITVGRRTLTHCGRQSSQRHETFIRDLECAILEGLGSHLLLAGLSFYLVLSLQLWAFLGQQNVVDRNVYLGDL